MAASATDVGAGLGLLIILLAILLLFVVDRFEKIDRRFEDLERRVKMQEARDGR